MSAIFAYISGNPVAFALLLLSVTVIGGIAVGQIKLFGVRLGIAGVLFFGIVLGHFGLSIPADLLYFIRDFGLILFVYAVGTQVGPGFFDSLRKQGLQLNILAVAIVLLGVLLAAWLGLAGGIELPMAIGLLAGGTTNTPSLAAAQQVLQDLSGGDAAVFDAPSIGYALAYPFGVLGIILTMIGLRAVFRIHPVAELNELATKTGAAPAGLSGEPGGATGPDHHPQLIPLFLGIAFGIGLGILPIPVPGFPISLKLGLAGGPLVAALLLSSAGQIGPLVWRLSVSVTLMLREFGIALFLGCVGIQAGGHFVQTLVMGNGLYWMSCAALITALPLLLVGFLARLVLKMNYLTLCGLLAGSMTDPPALAFAHSIADSDAPAVSYSSVYPLVMLLRIFSVQVLIFLLF